MNDHHAQATESTSPFVSEKPGSEQASLSFEGQSEQSAAPAEGRAKKLVLVVEDDQQSQLYMKILLSKQYDIETVSTAQKALDIIMTRKVGIVLMDISLQGEIDGLQLTRMIRDRQETRELPVIAITAHAFPADRQRSLDAGCSDYLAKPFQRQQLMQLIEKFI